MPRKRRPTPAKWYEVIYPTKRDVELGRFTSRKDALSFARKKKGQLLRPEHTGWSGYEKVQPKRRSRKKNPFGFRWP